MTGTLLLTRRDVAELVPMADCIEAVEAAFRAQADGRTLPSAVLALHAPVGGFHIKAGGLRQGRLQVAAKINANFPGNPAAYGLPTIQGLIVLYDGDDGQPLAVMDSSEITALRTGAASAVAAKYLARPASSTLALVGCGKQAHYQLRALAAVLPLETILVYDRDPERAAAFVAALSAEASLAVRRVEDLRSALRVADVVVTCTPSKQAFVGPRDLRPGAFVAGVGADNPEKQELEPALLASSVAVVDSIDQAAAIGDLHHALTAGAVRREDVHAELWEVVAGRKPGRVAVEEITVFDSTGIAIEDVAAAALVYERAVASGRGQRLDFSA